MGKVAKGIAGNIMEAEIGAATMSKPDVLNDHCHPFGVDANGISIWDFCRVDLLSKKYTPVLLLHHEKALEDLFYWLPGFFKPMDRDKGISVIILLIKSYHIHFLIVPLYWTASLR